MSETRRRSRCRGRCVAVRRAQDVGVGRSRWVKTRTRQGKRTGQDKTRGEMKGEGEVKVYNNNSNFSNFSNPVLW